MNRETLKKFLILALLGGMAFIITLQSHSSIFSDGATGIDSSVFRYVAYAMQNGQKMYVDTFDHKGPLLYLINYWSALVSFKHGVWILGYAAMLIAISFGYKLVRFFAGRTASVLALIITYSLMAFYYEGGNLVEDWSLPFMAASLYIYTKYIMKEKTKALEVIVCGICCGAVLMIKANMIVLWIVYSVYLCIMLIKKKRYKEFLKCLLLFLSGMMLAVIPIIIYLWKDGALQECFNQYILFNLKYSEADWIRRAGICIFYLQKPEILLSFFSFIWIFYNKRFEERTEAFYTCVMIILLSLMATFLAVSQSGKYYMHYAMIFLPLLTVPIGILCAESFHMLRKSRSVTAMIVLYYCISVIVLPNWTECLKNVETALTSYDAYTEYIIHKYIDNYTVSGDLISVMGSRDYIYLRSERLSASKYSYQFPISGVDANIFTEYIQDLEKNQPKIIIWANREAEGYDHLFEKMEVFWNENGYKRVEESEYYVYRKEN